MSFPRILPFSSLPCEWTRQRDFAVRFVMPVLMLMLMLVLGLGMASPRASAAESDLSPSPWADFVEGDFPFFSSVLDARDLGSEFPADNLTPRGLILNLGHGCWACFDLDLLRVSALWKGGSVTPVSMSQGSYHTAGRKAPEGVDRLPRIDGSPWLANGIHPGWQIGDRFVPKDPRDRGRDPTEVGAGPLSIREGRFKAIAFQGTGVRLEYEVAGVAIAEWLVAERYGDHTVVRRRFHLSSVPEMLWLAIGHFGASSGMRAEILGAGRLEETPAPTLEPPSGPGEPWVVRVPSSPAPLDFEVAVLPSGLLKDALVRSKETSPPLGAKRWSDAGAGTGIVTRIQEAPRTNAFVLDTVELPTRNPWRRNVRLADIAFFRDGRAAVVTFDGDVWQVTGLEGAAARWQRFTSGLHEPLGICVREDTIFVHDRNGIWRLVDADRDGEADRHELFCNEFSQTAETREFASGLRLAPDGSFIVAKGGQRGRTLGRHSGTVLRVAPGGESVAVLAYGMRQPWIGVHPVSGLVTASDQQGHYVPTTPLHILHDPEYHGFLPLILPKGQHPAPIAEPLTWIPHPINASGAGQVWLTDERMGPLAGSLIHLGYYRPEIFRVMMHQRAPRPQAAVVSITRDLSFAPLTGAVNPLDGLLYVTGFQIWGTTARDISGIARLRPTGLPSTLPCEVVATDQGVLLRFDTPLDPRSAADPANYSAERWNYRRTADYGSPHYKLDGAKGQDAMTPSSAYLSRDRRSVLVGIPDMKRVMQMRLGWTLATADGTSFSQSAYFTLHDLVSFDAAREGFEPFETDLTPRAAAGIVTTPVSAREGQRLSELMGCVACHSIDGSILGKVGPSWKGLYGSHRELVGGPGQIADEDYLRESIREPGLKVVRGYESSDTGMPSYEGVMSDPQIESIILYIRTLK